MKKNFLKKAISLIVLTVMLIAPVAVLPVVTHAVSVDDFDSGSVVEDINVSKNDDLIGIITNVINVVIGLLALIAVVLVLISGFEWMTAQGDEAKVKKAQQRIKQALVGLVVIFLSYAIVSFVLRMIVQNLS